MKCRYKGQKNIKKNSPSKPISNKLILLLLLWNIILEKISPDEKTIDNIIIKDINSSNIFFIINIFFHQNL